MKLIIDIPEEMHEKIMHGYVPLGLSKYLMNGTPLPKGHADFVSRLDVIDRLYDWSNHSITDAETWHLRQVIGDIKSMPGLEGGEKYDN